MKQINGDANRNKNASVFFRSGDFAWRLEPDFGSRIPRAMKNLGCPTGCCDKDGNLYLVSRDVNRPIVVLDKDGNYIRDFGEGLFLYLHDIKITPNNTLLCVDSGHHVAREITFAGELVKDIGTLDQASDTGFDPDVWDSLRTDGRIASYDVYFNAGLDFVEKMRSIKRTAGPFNKPTGVAFNSKGEIFFSDGYGNAAVHKFSAGGELLKTWGQPGEGPGKFLINHAIWVDAKDRVWICDREGSSVHVFSDDGEILAYATKGFMQPTGVWGDKDYVYVGERGGGLSVFNMDMTLVAQIGFAFCSLRFHGICGNANSDLFVFPLHSFLGYPVMKLTRV
ncbi:hypothetical protein AGMMS50256_03400 [Betaproteobacteria bacterium]|nr:hypothetical protein AGMMS50256_03400 [Betaproteobacteria bacterium]